VHIEYEVYTGDAIRMKELPFVVGVLADLSGKPVKPLPGLKDRLFPEVNRDTFNDFLKAVAPHLEFDVDDKITNDTSKKIPVTLDFGHISDFTPEKLVKNIISKDKDGKDIKLLEELMDKRARLSQLLRKTDGNDQVSKSLWEIIRNTEERQKAREAATHTGGDEKGETPAEETSNG
jgi:type VI secretion system protein ImpB